MDNDAAVPAVLRTGEIVGFNVGGQVFETTLATLRSCGECVLSTMATTEVGVVRDRKGRIFIDRNPRIFALVLEHLRGAPPKLLDQETEMVRELVEEELRYFCIGGAKNAVVSDVGIRRALTGRHKQNVDSWLDKYRTEAEQISAEVLASLQELAANRKLLRTRCAEVWYGSEELVDDVNFPREFGKKKEMQPMKNTCREWFSDYQKTFRAVNEDGRLVTLGIPTDDLMKVMVSITKNMEQHGLSCKVVSLFQRAEEKTPEMSEMAVAFRFFERRVFGIKWTGAYDQ